MSTEAPSGDAAAAAKKKKSPIVLIALVIVLLGGGGGGAYWWFVARPAAAAAAEAKAKGDKGKAEHGEAEAEEEGEKPGILPLDAFVVNLADEGGGRYLRVTVSLLLKANEDELKELEENAVAKTQIRSAILELLAMQTAEKLITPEGKTELKKAIKEGVEHSGVKHLKVANVLFSEFIVQ